jgi:hypothetical protein
MKVRLASQHPLLGRGSVPAEFVAALQMALACEPDTLAGIAMTIAVDNSLAMASYAVRRGDRATITVDWAHIERALLFHDQICRLIGSPLAAEELLELFTAEVLLCASRKALSLGKYVNAREHHRMAVALKVPTAHERNWDEQSIALAVRFARFILHHEIAHQLCRNDPARAQMAFDAFQANHRKLVPYSSVRAEELYCDRYAIEALLRLSPTAEVAGLVPELSLLMLHLELWSVVSLSAHLDQADSNSIAKRVATELVADRVYRSDQASRLFAATASTSASNSSIKAWFRVLAALQQAVEQALIDGMTATAFTSWGEIDHIRSCSDELLHGITSDAEADIRAKILAES